ncbi:MAG: ATP-binding cassette domain-containing protein [Myxococcaceae bacterium]|nr:ATP-binding cassette domain-containing protein [Myxococcaceae bacterium]
MLRGVDLTVERGQIHALRGPNGAGKSTLLSAVLGEIPFEGTVCRAAGRVGYVPQRFTADAALPWTVRDFLALARSSRPAFLGTSSSVKAHIDAMLAAVGLGDAADKPLGGLSGGELKRLLFAHAVDPLPALLLLDEPAAGLDAVSTERLYMQLTALKAQGCAILLVSHDPLEVADQVTQLREGRVVA